MPLGTKSGSSYYQTDSRPIQDPAFWADIDAANMARKRVVGLLDECRYGDAYEAISAFREEQPGLADLTGDTAAECAVLTGHYEEAYGLLLPLIRQQGMNSPGFLLAISLASAELGQVYPGQAEFCRDRVMACLSEHFIHDSLDSRLAERTDAKAVAIMSCLALGVDPGGAPYLEMALQLDPQNVLAANQLIERYTLHGRVTNVRRIASGMLKSLPTRDPHRAAYERTLAEAK